MGLSEALAAWDLCAERQVTITTDNGTNIIKAVELDQWTRIQCFGHRLHFAIKMLCKIMHNALAELLGYAGRLLEEKKDLEGNTTRDLSQVLSTDCKVRGLLPSWQDLEVLESVNKSLSLLQDYKCLIG